uniref:Uncharacterized protein n=1 Tax=Cyclopterus lumpus TaxID=8103 RepID=A0A8C2X7V5_CYCLU
MYLIFLGSEKPLLKKLLQWGPIKTLCLFANRVHVWNNCCVYSGQLQQDGVCVQLWQCDLDGGWTPWSVWSDCSVTCGHGAQVRTRACINPPPRNNGSHCSGPDREFTLAPIILILLSPDDLCPWLPWSPCSRSCGAGSASRRRVCVCEEGGDAACPDNIEAERNREETQLCYRQPCPGTGTTTHWSVWSAWTACAEPCSGGVRQRYRRPTASPPGPRCKSQQTQSQSCNTGLCPVSCEWSSWSPWRPCSASCGTGQQSSTRIILQPSRYGGAPCEGPEHRTKTCMAPNCGEGEERSLNHSTSFSRLTITVSSANVCPSWLVLVISFGA